MSLRCQNNYYRSDATREGSDGSSRAAREKTVVASELSERELMGVAELSDEEVVPVPVLISKNALIHSHTQCK